MDRREIERLLTAIDAAVASDETVALATIVRVRGNAYRREGTRMVVRQDGTCECALSGGCLEPAVADAAQLVLASGDPRVIHYDLADDSLWGLNIGCSGAVDILIERVERDDPITQAWLASLRRGERSVLLTSLAGISGRRLVPLSGAPIGHLSDERAERAAEAAAHDLFDAPHPCSRIEQIGSAEVFCDIAVPPPHLVIFGGGFDAVPLSAQAWSLGFAVTVIDPRGAFLTADRFPPATLISAQPSDPSARAALVDGCFAVVMNHHLERDKWALHTSLESTAAYVGVLGPRSRFDRLLRALTDRGFEPSAASLARVRSPVGLALGAETPDEVAASILGEIVAIRRGFHGGFLSGSVDSLHQPVDRRVLARS